MKIGNVELKNAIALAPMAGVTDLPFRLLCKDPGMWFDVHGDGQREGAVL